VAPSSDISQLDVAVSRLSAMTCDRTDSNQPTLAKSSISDFRLRQPVNHENDDEAVSMSTSSAIQMVELRQPIVVMQPRTVVRLSAAATNKPPVTQTVNSVSAPTGASKLVPSPSSAFSIAQAAAEDSGFASGRASNGNRDRGRSASRQPKQGSSAVKRMAMLFEEPNSRRRDQSFDPPSKAMSTAQASGKRHNILFTEIGCGSVAAEIPASAVSSELFFFSTRVQDRASNNRSQDSVITAVSKTLGLEQPDAVRYRSHSDVPVANVRITGQEAGDRCASGSHTPMTATATSTTFVTTKSANLRRVDGDVRLHASTSSSLVDRQSRHLVVTSTENTNKTSSPLELQHIHLAENVLSNVANKIEIGSNSTVSQLQFTGNVHRQHQPPPVWTFDQKVVDKSANIKFPNQLRSASPLTSVRHMIPVRDRLNVDDKSSDLLRPVGKSTTTGGDRNRLNKTDTFETAMTALESAISMLGSAVADRTEKVAVNRSKSAVANRPNAGNQGAIVRHVIDHRATTSNGRLTSGSKADRVNAAKFQDDLSLQTTLNLLDRTIVEIDSAISVSDLRSGKGNLSRTVNDRSMTSVSNSSVHRWSPSTNRLVGDIFGLYELDLYGTESKTARLPLAEVGRGNKRSAALTSGSRVAEESERTSNSTVGNLSLHLAEKKLDISNARCNARCGDVQQSFVVNGSIIHDFRTSNGKPSDFSSLAAASLGSRTTDTWGTTENRVFIRQMATAAEPRRIPPPLVKEDSFNRPDSPLFHETLPLPTDSAIMRYRQQRPGAGCSRSGRRSQQKQATDRQSSSSDSDTSRKRAPQTRRHQRQRSSSAGARLQCRDRRTRNRYV